MCVNFTGSSPGRLKLHVQIITPCEKRLGTFVILLNSTSSTISSHLVGTKDWIHNISCSKIQQAMFSESTRHQPLVIFFFSVNIKNKYPSTWKAYTFLPPIGSELCPHVFRVLGKVVQVFMKGIAAINGPSNAALKTWAWIGSVCLSLDVVDEGVAVVGNPVLKPTWGVLPKWLC